QHKLGGIDIYNFSLYEENGEWYAIGADLFNIYRFEFGADLKNNAPTATQINGMITPAVSGNHRSIILTKGCGQTFGYIANGYPNRWKLNFSGDITSASITNEALMSVGGGTGTDGAAGMCP